jgi:hypothetical protein
MEVMQKISAQALPQVVLNHIAAHNNHDPDAFMATLAPDTLVNDAKREFLGHPAIRAWADKKIFGDNVILEIESAFEQSGSSVVRCRADGDFDKSKLPHPVILTYYFAIRGNLITQVIILLNNKNAL